MIYYHFVSESQIALLMVYPKNQKDDLTAEIRRGERQPSREFQVDGLQVKEIRKATGLSQAKFAKVIDVHVSTLQNWEQGRREPIGPAKALLCAIKRDPVPVLQALAG